MAKKTTSEATFIKDHRYDFPLERRGEKKRRAVKVMLTEGGFFKLDYPNEVVDMFYRGDAARSAYAYATDMNSAISSFERTIERYKNAIQTAKREKVILVKFLHNKPGPNANFATVQLQRASVNSYESFAGYNALAITYEVMWRFNDALWDVPIDERDGSVFGAPHHRHALPLKDRALHVLDWTEEREQFLSNMCYSLESLIDRLRGFFGSNLLENMTLAIATGGGLAALPAPRPEAG